MKFEYVFYVVLVFGLYRFMTPKMRGVIGELKVRSKLSKLPSDKYKVLNDILIKTKKGTTQIDHVVISIYGIFIIETKNYTGRISGNDNEQEWIKELHGNKYHIRNPVIQNQGHVIAISKALKINKNKTIPIVVFLNECTLNVKAKSLVLHIDKLLPVIERTQEILFSEDQVRCFRKKIKSLNKRGLIAKLNHIKYVKGKERDRKRNS